MFNVVMLDSQFNISWEGTTDGKRVDTFYYRVKRNNKEEFIPMFSVVEKSRADEYSSKLKEFRARKREIEVEEYKFQATFNRGVE